MADSLECNCHRFDGAIVETCPGHRLHQDVPPSRWCITKQDLMDFRRRVKRAIAGNVIEPTEVDSFAPDDNRVGPNVYTVNEQFIKPVTREAGSMSWALMLHPVGLQCDLFITHAWAEGIFEFIDKAVRSWPRNAFNGYCCMLANPQNLGISDLIRTPKYSPFASALQSAHYVLVIPNQKVGIYNRLWCVYEAYLAYESNKEFVVARPPAIYHISKGCVAVISVSVLSFALGVIRHSLWRQALTHLESKLFWFAVTLPFAGSVICTSNFWLVFYHLCGAFFFSYYAVMADFRTDWETDDPRPKTVAIVRMMMLCGLVYVLAAEIDRVRVVLSRRERVDLMKDYTGCVLDAKCTDPSDELAIFDEIGSKTNDIDKAIQVLLIAGMWTRDLRVAFEAGVDITDAGHTEYALVSSSVMFSFLVVGYIFSVPDVTGRVETVIIFVLHTCTCIFIVRQRPDERSFSVRLMSKMVVPYMIIAVLLHVSCAYFGSMDLDDVRLSRSQASLALFFNVAHMPLTYSGLVRVVRFPWCGASLARVIMGRGCRCNAARMAVPPTKDEHHDVVSTDSDSSYSSGAP